MSSSSGPMTERLLCCICLDVLNDPVSTPCGHNFCKICLNTCWDNRQYCRCPYCEQTFNKRPELKINTTLRDLVDHLKKNTAEKPEVLCDICDEVKLKAVKSCLVCQSSYCETHLEPHMRVTGLQKHKLIDPVNNLQDYICQKHERPLELFCRDDQTRVCLFCTDGDHKNHNTVPLREGKYLKDRRRQQKFTSAFHVISMLVKRLDPRMWFLVVPVGISLLMFFSFSSSTDVETLNNVEKLSEVVLKWMQQYEVDVTLDPDTANPYLILSDDNKQVSCGNFNHKLPDNPMRFNHCLNVLGKQGFLSGSFYYEVLVKGKTEFSLGVAQKSVNRKGQIMLTPQNGFWTVVLRNGNDYRGAAGPDVFLLLKVKPQKVGVFVDYEKGLVLFYEVESRSHIFSYTGQSFTGKLYPFFSTETNNDGRNSAPLIITPVNK